MTATDRLVELVRTATPSPEALEHAGAQLAAFHRAAGQGADQPVVVALRTVLAATGRSPWRAWLTGTAADAADAPVEWVAVCAAAAVLAPESESVLATALGYQVAAATAAALGPAHSAAGWCVRTTAGTVGAAATAGRLLGLDPAALRAMFGICATQAAGITSAAGTGAASVAIGKAAANAVEAALLARQGFTSSARPLEGRRGMFALMSPDSDESALLAGLSAGAGAGARAGRGAGRP